MEQKIIKRKNMRKIILLFSIISCLTIKAQDSTTLASTPTDKPVKNTFYSNVLLYQQTVETPLKGGMQLIFAHRFGSINNGIKDLFGIYGGINIRMSFSYAITNRIVAGFGSTMPNTYDLNGKVAILKQTKSNSMPVSVSLFADMAIDARDKSTYNIYTLYSNKHRFSYFYQLMIARKFGNIGSLQVSPIAAYYNAVEKNRDNLTFGMDVTGRLHVYSSFSVIGQYTQALPSKTYTKPGGGAGFEITTSTHSFQVFLTNYTGLLQQKNLAYNSNSFSDSKNLGIGFNITIRL